MPDSIVEVPVHTSGRRRIARRSVLKRKPRKSIKKPPKKRTKARSISKLKKELDAIFSKFIRERDKGQCYTCPKRDEVKKMQNGHFVPRQYLAVRYDEVNCHCQCYACNMLYNGQPSAYAARLERDYGKGTVEMLESKRKILVKDFPYEEWILIYREKLADLIDNNI